MLRRAAAGLLVFALGCAADNGDLMGGSSDDGFVQPGLDDPTARQWVKAGSWYPADPMKLDMAVEDLLAQVDATPKRAIAITPPHASLHYSGPTAKEVWARVKVPDTILIFAPDHWGNGEHAAIWTDGPWLVPGHAVEIDYALEARVMQALPDLVPDRVAFSHHETEMLLPYITTINPNAKIVPVALFDNEHHEYDAFDLPRLQQWGVALADVLRGEKQAGREVLLIGTTDLVHHETLAISDEYDAAMMDFISALDAEGLYNYVNEKKASICGEVPTTIMMIALEELGYTSMEILARGNSFHVLMDENDVIGYPALAQWPM